jgi:hypothetical protein
LIVKGGLGNSNHSHRTAKMTDERRFTIKTAGDPKTFATFYTGHAADGRQLLVGWGEGADVEGLVFLWFDADGRFLNCELFNPPGKGDRNHYLREFRTRRKEVGYRPGPIRVRHFHLDTPFLITIRRLSGVSLALLCSPYAMAFPANRCVPFDQLASWIRRVKDGVASGHFELYWGENEGSFSFDQEGNMGLWEPAKTHVEPDRVYTLQDCPRKGKTAGYWTGRLSDGCQAVMGAHHDTQVLLLRFDAEGDLVESLTRPASPRNADHVASGWQQDLGWQAGPIQVRAFMALPEHDAYIADGPWDIVIGKYDPYFYADPKERRRRQADVVRWEEAGNFALWWGRNCHCLGPDGRVARQSAKR